MNGIRITAVALLATTPLALAACSSSGSSTTAKAPNGVKSSLTTTSATSTAAPADGQSSTTSTDGSAASGGGDMASFCTLIGKNNKVLMDIAAGDNSASGVDATKLLADLQDEVDKAPAAIKGDIETIVNFDRALIEKHVAPSETPELSSAMQHYATWLAANCKGLSSLPTS